MTERVFIVLATFNGARHLAEQVRSLQAQDFSSWELLARDDGSSDGTDQLLQQLASTEPRLRVLPGGARLGVIGNFEALLREARDRGASHIFLCDQDDVWKSQKMSLLLGLMRELEARYGTQTPVLVHSDLEVTDESLHTVNESFVGFAHLHPPRDSPLDMLLMQNFVTGCASVLNRALVELALPFPDGCMMHDWWLAQCAAGGGQLGFLPQATVRYRQHAQNQVGTAGAWGNSNPFSAAGRRRLGAGWRRIGRTVAFARQLHQRLLERGGCSPQALELVDAYARLGEQGPRERFETLRRLNIDRRYDLGGLLVLARMGLLGTGLFRGS